MIVLPHELDMIVVTTADPLHFIAGDGSWKHEKAIIDLVVKPIKSLPKA